MLKLDVGGQGTVIADLGLLSADWGQGRRRENVESSR